MTQTKYYLKEKCDCLCHSVKNEIDAIRKGINKGHNCKYKCQGKGFIRGADVTELIERIYDLTYIGLKHNFDETMKKSIKDLIEVVEE